MKYLWIYLALLAMIASASSTIWLKVIDIYQTKNNIQNNTLIMISYSFVIMGIISFLYLLSNRLNQKKATILKFNWSQIMVTFILAILLILNNLAIFWAFKNSPNIGYSHLIINLNVILTFLMAVLFFKQKFNVKCLIGLFITLIGLSIFIYYTNS